MWDQSRHLTNSDRRGGMPQNWRKPQPPHCPSHVAQGQRAKTVPCAPRGPWGPPMCPDAPFVPPPPVHPHQTSFRTGRNHGSDRRRLSAAPPPPPPPYPPPQPYCYGVMPQPPAPFDYPLGTAPVGRTYGCNYGVPPPPGLPVTGGSQRWLAGVCPQPMPYGQAAPPIVEVMSSSVRPGRLIGTPRGPTINGRGTPSSRSVGGALAVSGKHQRPAAPAGHAFEPPALAGAPNGMGLPVRPGEPDCKHFLSRGWCSYGGGCKYNHPEVVPIQAPAPPPLQPMAHGQGMMGLPPNPWAGVGMQYPRYGWPMPQMLDPIMYAPNWGCQPPSTLMYYPPAPPPLHKMDKRQPQPPSYSARSSDSAASSSSRVLDPDNLSDRKAVVGGRSRR